MHLKNQLLKHDADGTMRAMLLDAPLRLARMPIPFPSDFEISIRVTACGVCRTDLHIADGDLIPHKSPLILGHEVVGRVRWRCRPVAAVMKPVADGPVDAAYTSRLPTRLTLSSGRKAQ